jgi:hypothetical protein
MPEIKDIHRVNKPAITTPEAQQEVDATPTGEGMQVPVARPVTREKAPPEQYSSMFVGFRAAALAVGLYNYSVPNIPKYWVVYVNANSAAAATVQVESSQMNVTLAIGGHVKFPGRSPNITVTIVGGVADISVFNLGDDDLVF